MTIPTVAVTCTASNSDGTAIAGALFRAKLDQTEIYQGFVVPKIVEGFADENGVCVLHLWPNQLGVAGSLYIITAIHPETSRKFLNTTASVPNINCNLHQILVQDPYPTVDAAQQALIDLQAAQAGIEANRMQTGEDRIATGADRRQTGLDRQDAIDAAVGAMASLNDFKGRYYGALTATPTLDPLGNAMEAGDMYYSIPAGYVKVYTGATWERPAFETAAITQINAAAAAVESAKTTALSDMASDVNAVDNTRIAAQSAMADDVVAVDNSRIAAQSGIADKVALVEAAKTLAINTTIPAKIAEIDPSIAASYVGQAAAQAGVSTTQAALSAAAKVQAETAQALAQAAAVASAVTLAAKDTIPLGRASVADGTTFWVKPNATDGLTRFTNFLRTSSTTQTFVADQIIGAEFDAVVSSPTGSAYAIVEMDKQGRMSRYVDALGQTFVKLVPEVVLPGAQVVALPRSALSADLQAVSMPSGNSFLAGEAVDTAYALIDSTGKQSELSIDLAGQFPAWVASAIVRRGGVKAYAPGVNLPEAYLDASTMANSAAIALDTGQASVLFGGAPLSVVGGEIVHSAINNPNNAGYVQVLLGGKVSGIGAAFKFSASSGGSSIALVLPASAWANGSGGVFIGAVQAGVHFVLLANGDWHVSNWTGGGEVPIYASGNCGDLRDNLTRYVDIKVDQDASSISILLPNGTISVVANALISANTSTYAVWELYEYAAPAERARFVGLWAQGRSVYPARTDQRPLAAAAVNFSNQR